MKIAVITGANRGIGLALSQERHHHGYHVFATCRQSSEELGRLERLGSVKVIERIDVAEDECRKNLLRQLENIKVDLLINNAGTFEENEDLFTMTADGFGRVMKTNAFAPYRLALEMLPQMTPHGKMAFISSYRGSINRLNSGKHPAPLEDISYNCSKLVMNMLALTITEYLQKHNKQNNAAISTIILHPGYVPTRMTEHKGNVDLRESVKGMMQQINQLTVNTSGRFKNYKGEELPF